MRKRSARLTHERDQTLGRVRGTTSRVIERPLGAGEDFTRLLSYVSWRIFDFRFLFGIHSASSDGSSDHVEAPFTHVW